MRNILAIGMISVFTLASCKNEKKDVQHEVSEKEVMETTPEFTNKGHELVYNMTQKVGDYNKLMSKNDVIYTYTYQTPDGKTDVTTEKYMFNGELSYGKYTKHERSLAELEGTIEQGYDGNEYWLKHEGKVLTDSMYLKRVAFNRPTNFYWFTMMPKLMDPGVIYEHVKEQTVAGVDYDVVKVTFESPDGKPKDIYQLYINRETTLVDQFLFTVMDFGKSDPLLMELEYENIDGILLPTKRRYKASNWDAEVTDGPWVLVNWTNITFNNGLTKADFTK